MKKVLFASTALIATASVAAAEVKFSGYGRFGISYQEDNSKEYAVPVQNTGTNTFTTASGATFTAPTTTTSAVANIEDTVEETILVSRFRLNIDGIAETDGGVRFEARVRLQADDTNDGEAGEAGLNGARFSVIYGGLRVDAGNIAGSFDNLANYYGNEPGLENFIGQYAAVDYDFAAYSSTGAGVNGVFFQYAVGDFAFGASYDQGADSYSIVNGVAAKADGLDRWDISATYTFSNITAAIAYGQTEAAPGGEKETLTVLTLGGEWGDFSGTLFVADDDVADDGENGTAYGLSAAYNLGAATTLTFAYGDGSGDDDTQAYGIGAIYDLGGGASLRGGIGQSKAGDGDSKLRADFGAQFNF
ncbi:porin [Ruegeria arenilitoris]|uniref:porin n=1 Tax=Ruegeria arenilitoris TaxID=1173585 RepID=UPI0014801F7E|nr:porin [Ruegeria arenilitoris]